MAWPLVSVIVLNYNGLKFLDTCLSSLLQQDYDPFEIILVDNASTDGSPQHVAEKFPRVRLIASERNLGFAAGNNLGIRQACGDFILILNPDTETTPGALRELVRPLLGDSSVGMTAPKLLQYHARELIDAAGIAVDRAGIAWNRKRGQRDDGDRTPYQVFGPSGSAALYRKTMLDQIGLFDEDYFAYYEDVDLAWRGQLAGWKCIYVPTAVVYHIHGASFRQFSARRLFLLGRNKWWTIWKDYPLPSLLIFLPWVIAADLASVLYSLFARRELHSVRGRLAALPSFPRMLRKRRVIQSWRGTHAV